jgi:hypothetical protein
VDSARNTGSMERALNGAFIGMMNSLTEEHGIDQKEAYLHFTANPDVRIHTYQFVGRPFTWSAWSSSRSTYRPKGSDGRHGADQADGYAVRGEPTPCRGSFPVIRIGSSDSRVSTMFVPFPGSRMRPTRTRPARLPPVVPTASAPYSVVLVLTWPGRKGST